MSNTVLDYFFEEFLEILGLSNEPFPKIADAGLISWLLSNFQSNFYL